MAHRGERTRPTGHTLSESFVMLVTLLRRYGSRSMDNWPAKAGASRSAFWRPNRQEQIKARTRRLQNGPDCVQEHASDCIRLDQDRLYGVTGPRGQGRMVLPTAVDRLALATSWSLSSESWLESEAEYIHTLLCWQLLAAVTSLADLTRSPVTTHERVSTSCKQLLHSLSRAGCGLTSTLKARLTPGSSLSRASLAHRALAY